MNLASNVMRFGRRTPEEIERFIREQDRKIRAKGFEPEYSWAGKPCSMEELIAFARADAERLYTSPIDAILPALEFAGEIETGARETTSCDEKEENPESP